MRRFLIVTLTVLLASGTLLALEPSDDEGFASDPSTHWQTIQLATALQVAEDLIRDIDTDSRNWPDPTVEIFIYRRDATVVRVLGSRQSIQVGRCTIDQISDGSCPFPTPRFAD